MKKGLFLISDIVMVRCFVTITDVAETQVFYPNIVKYAMVKFPIKYCFEIPNTNEEFAISYSVFIANKIVYILPDIFYSNNVNNSCKIFLINTIIGDVNTLSVSSNFLLKSDSILEEKILPILKDYSSKNKIEINLDFYD
jgi:hypothetical protein